MIFADLDFPPPKEQVLEEKYRINWPPKEIFEAEKEKFISKYLLIESESISNDLKTDFKTATQIARSSLSTKFLLYVIAKISPIKLHHQIEVVSQPKNAPKSVVTEFNPREKKGAKFTINTSYLSPEYLKSNSDSEIIYMCQAIDCFAKDAYMEEKSRGEEHRTYSYTQSLDSRISKKNETYDSSYDLSKLWISDFLKIYYPEVSPDDYLDSPLEFKKITKPITFHDLH